MGETLHDLKLFHFAKEPMMSVSNVAEQNDDHFKPKGLWLSVDDAWKEWCESESFGLENLAYKFRVRLKPDARVLHIATASELVSFTEKFVNREFQQQFRLSYALHWSRVALKYDGILIAPYIWSMRFERGAEWYYAWDIASGCIWNTRAIADVIRVETPKLAYSQGETHEAEMRQK
jgi:hypothetical protein